jgi:DNA-binding transcriptional regulator YhcF (GntR family)
MHPLPLAITVDLDGPVPVYRQIADELRGLVARGLLRDGDELPSVRELGAMVGVNQNTVARAYRILADEGLCDLKHGSGARVRLPSEPYRGAAATEEDGERRLDDLVSRWLLRGESRADVERRMRAALDRFFGAEGRARAGAKGRTAR